MKYVKPLAVTGLVVVGLFVAASLLDIVLVFLQQRFYSQLLFITTFGVAGVFAAVMGYAVGMEQATDKNHFMRASLIGFLMACGLLFFFPLARLEGGEYESAFKAYGVTTGLTGLIFLKGKPDLG